VARAITQQVFSLDISARECRTSPRENLDKWVVIFQMRILVFQARSYQFEQSLRVVGLPTAWMLACASCIWLVLGQCACAKLSICNALLSNDASFMPYSAAYRANALAVHGWQSECVRRVVSIHPPRSGSAWNFLCQFNWGINTYDDIHSICS